MVRVLRAFVIAGPGIGMNLAAPDTLVFVLFLLRNRLGIRLIS